MKAARHTRIAALIAIITTLGGCAIVPVPATERDRLAQPVMQRDAHALHGALEAHNYLSKESALGGSSVSGGGCGCN